MHVLVLLQAAAVDTAAVVKAVNDFFGSILPGLPEGFIQWVTTLILGSPVLAAVFAVEWVGALLLRVSPVLATFLAPHWARWKAIINPILAALFAGGMFHNPLIGLGAGVLWGMLNSIIKGWGGSTTPATLLKAKTAAIVLGLALLAPHPAGAAEAPKHYGVLSSTRFSLSPGAGYRWEKNPGTERAVPYWDVKLGYTPPVLWDHVKLDGRYGHSLGSETPRQGFAEASLRLVF